jgi:hypothetical protein
VRPRSLDRNIALPPVGPLSGLPTSAFWPLGYKTLIGIRYIRRFVSPRPRNCSTAENVPDFNWSIGWVVRRLSDFGSTAQPHHIATRVFAWVQNACSRSQWRRLRPIVQRHCAPAIWAELASKFGLDGEGAIA